jgi:hypothetical protein
MGHGTKISTDLPERHERPWNELDGSVIMILFL